MAFRGFAFLLFAVALTGACDVSQKRPETAPGMAAQVPMLGMAGHGMAVRGSPAGTIQVPEADHPAAPADAAQGERSIRLYGPGVSRHRQIRV